MTVPTRSRRSDLGARRRRGRAAGASARPPSASGCPRRRSWPATSASGGPWSTSTEPPGTSTQHARRPDRRRGTSRAARAVAPRTGAAGGRSRRRASASAAARAPRRSPCDADTTAARRTSDDGDARRRAASRGRAGDSTCADGPAGDDARDERDPRGAPAGEPRERRRGAREDSGSIAAAASDERDQRRHRRLGRDVRRHRPERDRAEVEPDDRRRDDAARDRDDEDVPEPRAAPGYASGTPATRGSTTKIAATAANDSWKPGSSPERRHPREQHERPDRERVPAVARPRDDPRERGEHAGDRRADDRRLPADRERVREHDARSRSPRRASRPMPATRATVTTPSADDRDVLARDGEQVHQPARLEVVAQSRGRCRCPRRARSRRRAAGARPSSRAASVDSTCARNRSATPPIPPRRPTIRGALAAQHDVDAAAREPAALVEAGLGPTRLDRPRAQLEDGALRRRALGRELEQHALADPRRPEAGPRPGRGTRTACVAPGR